MASVRVRIAPSPTGSPHVGTGYMGLFNAAFARSQGGQFILRIEDTDQTRSRPEYETGIFQALKWLGVQWDEGPDIGGPCGPYRQSERTEIYREHTEILLKKGAAYHCFCTPADLEKLREQHRVDKIGTAFKDPCRSLDPDETATRLADDVPSVVRLKVPAQGECVIHDRFRGEIVYDYGTIDDQILMKSDNFPTYHLANVVDDHLMGITHVIRGEEWVPSTPKHILLYEAFGWELPEFIHLPLLLNPDGSKLSKRKNPTSITYYRDAGYLPEALLNYLGLMSYSRPGQEEKFTLDEFISDFDITRMSLGGSVFDLKKLTWLNGRYLRENFSPETLWEKFAGWRLNPEFLSTLVPMMHNRLETLGDLIPAVDFLLATNVEYEPELLVPKKRVMEDIAPVIQTVLMAIEDLADWTPKSVETAIRDVADFWEWPIRDVTAILFTALMGRKVGPPLFESAALLGIDITRRRLINALDFAGGLGKKKLKKLEKRWMARSGQ